MNSLRINIAADINRAHELADSKAGEAIDHAVEAGKLLLEAKAAMPHGEWLGWLESNIWVTPRRCQQYMRAALGKVTPGKALFGPDEATKAKAKSISHLEVDAPQLFAGEPEDAAFMPESGYCYAAILPDTTVYAVEPSLNYSGYFFVSKMHAATDMVDYTTRGGR